VVFSSAVFLFYFLPVVLILYFLAQRSLLLQNIILFLSSFIFYFWGEKQYTILVLASVFFNYVMGRAIDRLPKPGKGWLLGLAVVGNLSVLLYYKYFGFLISNLGFADGSSVALVAENIHLPLGISFFTFHGLTYVIDIYRKDAQVSHNPLNVGLYTLFFPQLVAGPIVRYKDIDQQLEHRTYSSQRTYIGIKRFIIGLAKKLIIANCMGDIADDIYALDPEMMSAKLLWLAAIAYTLQIYFDFSGYSDMAIGLAKVFGFDFLENFNYPYAAKNIKDFWRRWHISLSTFFRDYVYIPLGGSKKGVFRTYLNLILVFFLTGIWHGASWNFVIWGLYHGSFLILERLGLERLLQKAPGLFSRFYTLGIVVLGWVLFRLEDFVLLKFVLKKMFAFAPAVKEVYGLKYFLNNYQLFVLSIGILFSFPVYRLISNYIKLPVRHPGYRISSDLAYVALFVLSLSIMASTTFNPFIYFRF